MFEQDQVWSILLFKGIINTINFSWSFLLNLYNEWNPIFCTMCFMNEIPEKEEILKPKKLEKEKQQENKSQYEEKPIMINAA